jgi:hypothetical protein
MEGMEHLTLVEDDPIIDQVSPYASAQLRRHEVVYQALLGNPPPCQRHPWARSPNSGGLQPATYAGEHSAPLVVVDTDQSEFALTPGGQPLIRTVTIDDAMPFCVPISSDAEVSLMSL